MARGQSCLESIRTTTNHMKSPGREHRGMMPVASNDTANATSTLVLKNDSVSLIPTHRRYEKGTIRQLIERVHPVDANEVFDALYLIRNTLAHVDRLLAPHSPTEVVLLIDVQISAILATFKNSIVT